MKKIITNPHFKDSVKFVLTSTESEGKISELELTLQTGGKNPIHYHKSYSETFTAIEGEAGWVAGFVIFRIPIFYPARILIRSSFR